MAGLLSFLKRTRAFLFGVLPVWAVVSVAHADSTLKYQLLGYPAEEAVLLANHSDLYYLDRYFELNRSRPAALLRGLGHPRFAPSLEIYGMLLQVRGDGEGRKIVTTLLNYIATLPQPGKTFAAIRTYSERVEQFGEDIRDCNRAHGLPVTLIKAIIIQESTGNPIDVSRAGAMGLMQLMPETARQMGVRNPFNPRENICGGIRYFKEMLDRFNWDVTLALAAYNAGPEKVVAYNGIPPYRETQGYVRSVKWIKNYLDAYARN